MRAADLAKDREWSRAVLTRDHRDGHDTCRWCGGIDGVTPHHIIKRRFREFRWQVENGLSFCYRCHEYAERNPKEGLARCRLILGIDKETDTRQWLRDQRSKTPR